MTSPELLQLVLEEAKAEGLTENVAYIVFGKCMTEGITDPNEARQRLVNERVRSDIENAKQRISEMRLHIDNIQASCVHPKNELAVQRGGNTGNWDPNDDSYWTTYKCGVCGLGWTKYSEK